MGHPDPPRLTLARAIGDLLVDSGLAPDDQDAALAIARYLVMPLLGSVGEGRVHPPPPPPPPDRDPARDDGRAVRDTSDLVALAGAIGRIVAEVRYGPLTYTRYRAHYAKTGDKLQVFLDGVNVTTRCVYADEICGVVECYRLTAEGQKHLDSDTYRTQYELLRGRVEIIPMRGGDLAPMAPVRTAEHDAEDLRSQREDEQDVVAAGDAHDSRSRK